MRLYFPSLAQPKRTAKILSRCLSRPLASCHAAIAGACGYRDWHELENYALNREVALLDQHLAIDEFVERQATISVRIAKSLGAHSGDVQFALASAPLTGNRVPDLREQLAIRAECYRKTSIPLTGRRQRGSVGKVKSPGWNGELVILKSFGQPTVVIAHKTPDTWVADFEFVSPRTPEPLFIPMRLYLAYGMWTETTGSIVLFSRDYMPLWRLVPGQRPQRANPWERISYTRQEWFWDDTETPWSNKHRYQTELARLASFGVIGLPLLVEALPLLVLRDDLRKVHHAVEHLHQTREPTLAA